MKVQKKITFMLAGITVLFLCSLLGIRYHLIYNNLNLFKNRATDKVNNFEQTLRFQQATLEMFTYDTTVNRAVIAFTIDRKPANLEKILKDAMPSFGVDAVWIYSPDNRLLHYQCRLPVHVETQLSLLDTDALKRMFQRGSRYRNFFKKMSLGIMEIRTAPASLHIYGEEKNQPPAIIIAGRLWSNAYINIIAKMSGAILQLLPMQGTENLEPVYDPATGRLNFARIIFDEDRRPLGVLDVSYETPLIEAFNRSSNIQVALLMGFGLVIFSLLAWSFAAWVVSPLKKISTSLRNADPAQVRSLTGLKNEFGTIAVLIENFFKQNDVLVAEIRERHEVEKALRQSQERFRAMVETTSDLIWEMNTDLEITYASPRSTAMFGVGPDELIGKNIADILIPESPPAGTGTPADMLKRREAFNSLIACVRHKDGRLIFIEASGMPIHDDTGRFIGYRGITRDITERRHIEDRLRQAQTMEAIGALAGGIAHDFNNILAAIMGYAEIAMTQLADPGETRKHLQAIFKATERAIGLVKQILTFSRKTEHEKKPVMPKIVIREAVNLLRATLPSTIEIRQHIDSDSVVLADPTQMHQVILNLCTNAGYAMREKGGILEISLTDADPDTAAAQRHPSLTAKNYVKLVIADTGSGIPPELIKRIFDPFFTTKPQGEGTGLGLSVVHGIIESCGGSISVRSKDGKGTAFEIYLPSVQSEISEVATAPSEPVAGDMKSILFVDDEPMLADIAKRSLESLGFRVTACTDSTQALEAFKKAPESFDAVVTDYTMPKINGLDLAQEIISIKPHLPIILCTGGTDDIGDRARALGINEFVLKPLKAHELAKTLHRAFNK